MKLTCTIYLALIATLISCSNERDRMKFSNSAVEVEASILRMNNLLMKLPNADVNNYFFDLHGELYINNQKIGKPEDIVIESVSELNGFSISEKDEFLELALFLKKNKISGSYLDGLFNTWVYSYDQQEDNSFANYRALFYQEPATPMKDIIQAHEILDTAGNLVLYKGIKNY